MAYESTQQNLNSLKKIYAEKTRRTIFFLGVGASAESGLPTWWELRENLHHRLCSIVTSDADDEELENFRELEEIREENDYWKYFDHVEKVWPTTYFDYLESAFDIDFTSIQTPIVYKKIWSMDGVRQIVTLNVDGLLAQAFNEVDRTKNNTLLQYDGYAVTDSKTYFARGAFCLLNLHGTVFQKSRWIMNESERKRLYEGQDKNRYTGFLTWLFQTHNVVFVGVNPRDIAVSQFIQLASETGLLETHFWICSSPNAETRRWAERNGVRLIAYLPESSDDGAQIHSTDICAILDDLERHTSEDLPVVLPATVDSVDPSTLGNTEELVTLLSTDRNTAIKKMSGAATFLGTHYGFSSAQLDSLIQNMSLPIQIATSLDTRTPPFNQIHKYKLVDKIQGSGSSSVWLCKDQGEDGNFFVAKP